jgi:protein CpxP
MNPTRWKVAVGTALLGLCSLAAYAQQEAPPQGPPPSQGRWAPGPERELKHLTQMLSLTPDQQTGVKAILEQQATQMKALHAKAQSQTAGTEDPQTRQEWMTQAKQIRDESDTKITALLDDNQKQTYAQWVQKRNAAMAKRRGPEGAAQPEGAGSGPGASQE